MEQNLPPPTLVESNPDHYLNREKQTIWELKDRIQGMKAQNYQLRKKIKELQQEKFKVTRRLQKDYESKIQQVNSLQIQINRMEDTYKREKEDLLKTHKEQLNCNSHLALSNAINKTQEQNQLQISELQKKLEELRKTEEFKTAIQEERLRLIADNQQLNDKLTHQQNQIQQHFRKAEQELKQRHEAEIRQLQIESLARAKNLLSKNQQDVHRENMKIVADLNMQQREVDDLKTQKRKAQEQSAQLKRELELLHNQLDECANKQCQMNKVIKSLQIKVREYEEERNEEMTKHGMEKEAMIADFNAVMQGKDAELANLRHQVKLRSKELKNLKGLAQMILDQRSDVEQFFLESLEQIKEEVQKRMAAEGKMKRLPSINRKGKVYNQKVELSDLDWEDRERVLRLLFSKMNMGVPAQNWRSEFQQ